MAFIFLSLHVQSSAMSMVSTEHGYNQQESICFRLERYSTSRHDWKGRKIHVQKWLQLYKAHDLKIVIISKTIYFLLDIIQFKYIKVWTTSHNQLHELNNKPLLRIIMLKIRSKIKPEHGGQTTVSFFWKERPRPTLYAYLEHLPGGP